MKLTAICLLLVVVMTGTELFAKDCFPQQVISRSPDKRYSILWKEPKDGEAHHLVIYTGKEKRDFFEFNRYTCVCWEPTGTYFSLTDYMGSNVSEAYIYSSSTGAKLLNILDIIPIVTRELYTKNYHSYIEVLSWTKVGMLVHIWGHGKCNPKGFDKRLTCFKKGEKWQCKEMRN